MRIGVIGCGNMGAALIRGMRGARLLAVGDLIGCDPDRASMKRLVGAFKIRTAASNREVVRRSEVIVLAVKPQQMDGVLKEIRASLTRRHLLVSIAAGITTGWIERRAGKGISVVRVMPNTPALVGEGMAAIAGGRGAGSKEIRVVERIFGCVGQTARVPEKWMDAVTAVSGSGPAYFFYLIEEMVRSGVALGLPESVAKKLVLQTAAGSAALARDSKEDPRTLRERVTSKGGTTEAAFRIFARRKLGEIVRAGIQAAAKKSKELAR